MLLTLNSRQRPGENQNRGQGKNIRFLLFQIRLGDGIRHREKKSKQNQNLNTNLDVYKHLVVTTSYLKENFNIPATCDSGWKWSDLIGDGVNQHEVTKQNKAQENGRNGLPGSLSGILLPQSASFLL